MNAVVVPYVDRTQVEAFLDAWQIVDPPDWLILVDDTARTGCAAAKNRGVAEAMSRGADVVVVLDDDCYPEEVDSLETFAGQHAAALEDQPVGLFQTVTDPPSRGTPHAETTLRMPVAASMGFWTGIGDYDAARQLAYSAAPMTFRPDVIHGRYFPLSGMNMAFRPADWQPWCTFIDVPRYDDIWMGWLWQREAYRRGACFNLNGPPVRHARQSNVWRNLETEGRHIEANETLWQRIALHPDPTYENLLGLLPDDPGGSDR